MTGKPRVSLGKSPDWVNGHIEMNHGSGGRASARLIETLFLDAFDNTWLRQGDDAAVLPSLPPGSRLVMATDGHVVSPLFFPGGNIGSLAVHGTVNDLAMMGATPLWLSAGFILEEGLELSTLHTIVHAMAAAAAEAGVAIVTGDTKVVERGKCDGIYVTTAGVGYTLASDSPSGSRAKPGDAILLSGSIGEHGMAILLQRESLAFETEILSDSAALHSLAATIQATHAEIHVMRDPTRGGLATTLNEIARQSGVGICINESCIPVKPEVSAACEFLGFDPLYLANEGKMLVICPERDAASVLAAMQTHPLGREATQIGYVEDDARCFVQMITQMGGRRMVDWLNGDPLPRIC